MRSISRGAKVAFLATTFLTGTALCGALAQTVTLDRVTVVGDRDADVTAGKDYHATRTSTATKTDTPLINVPQSVTVATKEQIKDTGAQKLEDVVRYMPGVLWHQGENNRDQVVIRGQSSNADFFVNGMRDDAQMYRDLYNAERVEVLKGPNAMIFGRGGGGGVLNRVLKEADGNTIREVTVQGGSFDNKRVSTDVGGKVTDTFAARLNAMYEKSGSYRDYVDLQRFGFNPTFTWTPTAATSVKLSYEHFYDRRTADRGVPSQGGRPYYPAGDDTFFGNPALSYSPATTNAVTLKVEHNFDNGLKVVNQARFQDTKRFYQNVYPNTTSPVTTAGNATLAAYNNTNDRQNLINQTDWTYKFDLGTMRHTLLFGTEFSNQKSANARFSGTFAVPGNPATIVVPASNPTTFTNVNFVPGLATDARNKTTANVAAAYAQDQIEITRWLQLVAGVRFDRFSVDYVNLNGLNANFGQTFNRVDNLVSPRAGIVVKPIDNMSIYASYSVSHLPASGDQFNALTIGTAQAAPEKFVNKEFGVKWDINPRLTYTAAVYQLDRTNQRLTDPSNALLFVLSGATRSRGFETTLAGKITDAWTVSGGYAYTDARIIANSGALLAGQRLALVPYHQFSLWNRYDFNDTWGAGLGVISMSDFFATTDNTVVLPAYTRLDAALFWKLDKNWRAQLNVENLNGVRYYPTADANNNITPGAPRTFRVSVTGSF